MKLSEKKKLKENYLSIFEGFRRVLEEHDLQELIITGLEFSIDDIQQNKDDSLDIDHSVLLSSRFVPCPRGYRKSYRFDPSTGKQTVICVPIK